VGRPTLVSGGEDHVSIFSTNQSVENFDKALA
jgi:hypothetical protein